MTITRRTAGCVVAAALMAASCGSKSKATTAQPTSSSGCHSSSGPGGSAADNVAVPGDIPDNQAYVTFSSPGGYTINVPEGWARSEKPGTVHFTDKFNSVLIQVTTAPTAPTLASVQSSDVPALTTSASCFQTGNVTMVSRTAGRVVLVTYRADSPPDSVTGKVVLQDVERYLFWKAGKEVIITLSAPKGSDNVDPWRKVTDSFRWTA